MGERCPACDGDLSQTLGQSLQLVPPASGRRAELWAAGGTPEARTWPLAGSTETFCNQPASSGADAAFGADAVDLIAIVSGIMLNLLRAFNRTLESISDLPFTRGHEGNSEAVQ